MDQKFEKFNNVYLAKIEHFRKEFTVVKNQIE